MMPSALASTTKKTLQNTRETHLTARRSPDITMSQPRRHKTDEFCHRAYSLFPAGWLLASRCQLFPVFTLETLTHPLVTRDEAENTFDCCDSTPFSAVKTDDLIKEHFSVQKMAFQNVEQCGFYRVFPRKAARRKTTFCSEARGTKYSDVGGWRLIVFMFTGALGSLLATVDGCNVL
uniref:Transmembrane protein n=1 Tax=Panagrellus redivivus TaxID=6233 RepID=A0A7E4VTJ6_PANRE